MKKVQLIIISALWVQILYAQDNQMIVGGIYDRETNEPLVSASIYYVNNPLGTITNVEGEFVIQKQENPDTLVISYVGYTTKRYPVSNLPEKIYLERSTINLVEVIVTPGYVNKLVKQIWEKYYTLYKQEKKNKNKDDTFFYRQITKSDSIYNEFIECFLTGKNAFSIQDMKLQQGRYGKLKLDKSFTFTNFFYISQMIFFRSQKAGKNEFITILQPDFEAIYHIEIADRIYSKDNGNIIVLNFQPKKNNKNTVSGKLYVNETDLSILRFEGIVSSFEINLKNKNKKYGHLAFGVNYKDNTESYPVVESVNVGFEIEMQDLKFQITSMLFSVDQSFRKSTKELKQKDILINQIDKTTYDPAFWENNPIVKRTKIDEEIIRSFESQDAFGTFKPE
ncbi:hypothetical protein FACS1894145_2460 [Bacteroidia bacterium]|nr:hypothetical protein FACS1894145_2460 [Bacteroidia bacterium]